MSLTQRPPMLHLHLCGTFVTTKKPTLAHY